MWEKCSCAQQTWFLCFLFQNNSLHIASREMSSPSWLQSLSNFWTSILVGSLMSHNDLAELLLQLHILPSNDQVPLCYVPHILYVPFNFQLKAVLYLPVTFLTASMSSWLYFTSSYSCSIGQQFVNFLKMFHIRCASHSFPLQWSS